MVSDIPWDYDGGIETDREVGDLLRSIGEISCGTSNPLDATKSRRIIRQMGYGILCLIDDDKHMSHSYWVNEAKEGTFGREREILFQISRRKTHPGVDRDGSHRTKTRSPRRLQFQSDEVIAKSSSRPWHRMATRYSLRLKSGRSITKLSSRPWGSARCITRLFRGLLCRILCFDREFVLRVVKRNGWMLQYFGRQC